ncbi:MULTISPECIES: hypothetical protein [unclassified Rhizobium]|uniref:hypothetical protein n=1 Tax=unclassified Rhizobium TaxID=2613769 RepID=UPI000EA973EC|nr:MULTISPECIES: hypothetical protein [unclassified Rhizobium]AYG68752.1 hypothetical protein CCGE531_21920 [Rhizobium sp. CCGE531]AYG75138.1 hypothetical protein CCGE532_21395 [Rhizobium sp. CCGE532]
MNKLTVVESSGDADTPFEDYFPAKKLVITMGGCNFVEIFSHLTDAIEFTHFWRAVIPSIMSPSIVLHHANFEDAEVSRFVDRETSKVVYKRIEESPDSIIAFEAAGDFVTGVFKIGETIIPDIRNEVFGPAFKDIAFKEESELNKADLISADSPYYWDMWKYSFNCLYDRILKDRIQRGIGVFFLSRRFCTSELKDGEFVPLHNARTISERNLILDDIEDFISKYDGVKIMKSALSLEFTSTDAPWGGPWEYHPQGEYYAYMRAKFLDAIFPGKERGSKYIATWMAKSAQSLSKTKALLVRADSEATVANNLLTNVRSDGELVEQGIEIAGAETEVSRREAAIAKADREAIERALEITRAQYNELDGQLRERDGIIQRSHDLTQALRAECFEKDNIIAEQAHLNERLSSEIFALEIKLSRLETILNFVENRYSACKSNLLHRMVKFFAIHFDANQLRRFGFNEKVYLEENADVRASKANPLEHYLAHGMREGRTLPKI